MTAVTIVSGFGRCGSSLVCQMLNAGGIPARGKFPSFEPEETNLFNFQSHWVSKQTGAVVKVLDIHLPEIALPPANYRTIWLDRNRKQQAASHAKFGRLLMGLHMNGRDRRALAASYKKDRPVALKIITSLGPWLGISFENLINNPANIAAQIAEFCGMPDTAIPIMADAVLSRTPENQPSMKIEMALIKRSKATDSGTSS